MIGDRIIHPTAVVIPRADPRHDRSYTDQRNERLPVVVEAETSPRPVDYSAFYGAGRDRHHAWGHIWRYSHLAIQDKLSIAAQFFGVAKVPSALVVGMPQGAHNPARERANIESPGQTTLGAKSAVLPHLTYAPQYAKII